ncbi:VOC family protein [Paracoccus pacificus]|uniref:VOC family protein n=1 Tax=Paracoccus pacificus TaxID=1463598 RepID=A0ABW4R646_9RHOB
MATEPPPIIGTLETALYAADLAAAEKFWGETIGLRMIARVDGRHVFFRCGAQVLLIFNPAVTEQPPTPDSALPVPAHGARGPGHFCMSAARADIDGWRAYLTENAVEIEADIIWPNGARSIYFRDPAGNSIEIAEAALWS